jgi:anaerobic ribonucleoside-triphosphate reductase activating protein
VPELWPRSAGRPVPSDRLAARILAATNTADDLGGITISGGEPFDQAEALSGLVRALRCTLRSVQRRRRWDFAAYSGYTLDEIRTIVPAGPVLLAELDALIDGKFERSAPATRPWRGSSNQILYPLSPRGRRRWVAAEAAGGQPRDLGIDKAGRRWLIGSPWAGRGEPSGANAFVAAGPAGTGNAGGQGG